MAVEHDRTGIRIRLSLELMKTAIYSSETFFLRGGKRSLSRSNIRNRKSSHFVYEFNNEDSSTVLWFSVNFASRKRFRRYWLCLWKILTHRMFRKFTSLSSHCRIENAFWNYYQQTRLFLSFFASACEMETTRLA